MKSLFAKLSSLFYRVDKTLKQEYADTDLITSNKHIAILNAPDLFEYCKLDSQLTDLKKLSGFDDKIFEILIKQPINTYAELVQLAPASEAHHHAGPGGLLKHTLDVIQLALKKRKNYQLPIGGSIRDIEQQRHLWTYAVFVGCLLHDIGKLSANTRLIALRSDGSEFSWSPQHGPMTMIKKLRGYRVEFAKTPYRYHERLALTHWDLLPKEARTWLVDAQNIMAELTAWLWGDKYESGVIGEIVEFADRESTAKNLQLPSDIRFSQAIPVIERYLTLLRQWIQYGSIRINVNGGMGWVDKDGFIYLVCRSLAEKLIQECNQMGLKNLPQDPVRVYDILQEHGYALPTESGKAIWTIKVCTEEFSHQFTCLKFDGRKLTTPSKILKALEGEIFILDTMPQETQLAKPTTARTAIEGAEAVTQTIPPIDTEKKSQDSEGAVQNKQETETHPINDTVEITSPHSTAASERNLEESVSAITIAPEPVRQESESKPAGTKIKETENNSMLIKSVLETTSEAAQEAKESGSAITSAIARITNFDYDAPDTADKFLRWLQRGILEKTIVLNSTISEVHIVEEGIFLLAPAIFKTFLRLHGLEETKHNNLSKRFARLRVNIKENDLNVQTYWVKSTNRATAIKGWLLPFNVIYENDFPVPAKNKYIFKHLTD